ncbi:hypothetical protein SapgrDRAFT_3054 [Saprospira grandis DSM 2844]|uniref:Outer membrane protein beta-barrel domain-containing protein n=1 Tax=Saprospira grandis DSM 2844 TaxID=694433 RepID=J1I8C8_9BACT|nr:hypothetical protein [Saprospira grandis]EJF54703.1 hypothetical protein SapgrDRAFT_3054 [Saprospira grandis DSM 2844]
MFREEEKDLLGQRLQDLPKDLQTSAPAGLWDDLDQKLDDLALDEQLKDKLSTQKASAPTGLWSAISTDLALDQDALLDEKIRQAYAEKKTPKAPAQLWSAIDQQLELEAVWTKMQQPLDQLAFRYRLRLWGRRLSWAALLLLFCKACGPEITEGFWSENKTPLVQKTSYEQPKKEQGKALGPTSSAEQKELPAAPENKTKNAARTEQKAKPLAKNEHRQTGPKRKAGARQLRPKPALQVGEEQPENKAKTLAAVEKEEAFILGQAGPKLLAPEIEQLAKASAPLLEEKDLAQPLLLPTLLAAPIALEESAGAETGPKAPFLALKQPYRKHYLGLRSSLEQQLITNDFQQKKVEYQHLSLLLAAEQPKNPRSWSQPSFNWALDYRYAFSRNRQLQFNFWWSKNMVKTYDYSYGGRIGEQRLSLNYMTVELGLEQSLYRLWQDRLQGFVVLGAYTGKLIQFKSSRNLQSSGYFLLDYNDWEYGLSFALGQRHKLKGNWELQYGLESRFALGPLLEDFKQDQRSYAHAWGLYFGLGKKF